MLWNFFLIWIATLSVITFCIYGYDKAQAKLGGWRVPEKVLHALALGGGFPGGWLGRLVFRHKTRKGIFTVILGISTMIYGVIAFLIYPG